MDTLNDVRTYYDANSHRFANWGRGKTSRSIHREVWGEGVKTPTEATWYVDFLIGNIVEHELTENTKLHVLDLGCGLAGTLSSLAMRFPSLPHLTGVTISPVQVRTGQKAIYDEGLSSRVSVMEGDFHDLPPLPSADVVYAIEAFVHARDSREFFRQAYQVSSNTATLVLIDDFLVKDAADELSKATFERLIQDFSTGWHAPNIITVDEAVTNAREQGFTLVSELNLTHQLRIGRRRDRFIDVLYRMAGPILIKQSYLGGLMGGAALQRAISRGWINYSMLVFTKSSE